MMNKIISRMLILLIDVNKAPEYLAFSLSASGVYVTSLLYFLHI